MPELKKKLKEAYSQTPLCVRQGPWPYMFTSHSIPFGNESLILFFLDTPISYSVHVLWKAILDSLFSLEDSW